MTTCMCWMQQPQKRSYLVHLTNDEGESHDIIVQTPCTHDMQEWVNSQIFFNEEGKIISGLKVIHIDAEKAAHVPIVDEASVN